MIYINTVLFVVLLVYASKISNKLLRIRDLRIKLHKKQDAIIRQLDERQNEVDRQEEALNKKADENFRESCELLYTWLRMEDKKPPERIRLSYPEWYEKLMDIKNGYVAWSEAEPELEKE